MSISNDLVYDREVCLDSIRSSCFLLGPRMTGKTSILKSLKFNYFLNLLLPESELKYAKEPKLFWEEIQTLKPGSLAIVDEIQRVPSLLDYVQLAIEDRKIRFILSGSSARKLKRGNANLLGGRAIEFNLHPLSQHELGKDFIVKQVLRYGSLPKIATLLKAGLTQEVVQVLKTYVTVYLKEEIQAEALVRKLDCFQRFLDVAAQSNGQMIEFDNIARECQVASSTVKEYFQVLEDTLIGFYLWPWNRSERKKARPKFFFFDCGVLRAIQERLTAKPSPEELGVLFETWMLNEFIRIRDYAGKEHRFSLWREAKHEVDILVERGKTPILAVECKSGRNLGGLESIKAFKGKFPKVLTVIASLTEERKRKLEIGVQVWPFQQVLEYYRSVE